MSIRRIIAAIIGLLFVLIAITAYFVQENIVRSLINPRIPYEAYTPPPRPDYANYDNWLSWPEDSTQKAAAIFYVHDTTYRSADHWNAPVNDKPTISTLTRVSLPNEAGPFTEIGAIFAPRYRQATLFAFFTKKHQGRAARKTAYRDVKSSFRYFLNNTDNTKPIILVGYGQGGLHVQGLLLDFFQNDPDIQRRLAAAYIIGQSTPLDLFNYTLPQTPPCKYTADVRCVVSWNAYTQNFESEIERKQKRLLVWEENTRTLKGVEKRPLLCTNPLNWTLTDELVDAENTLARPRSLACPLISSLPSLKRPSVSNVKAVSPSFQNRRTGGYAALINSASNGHRWISICSIRISGSMQPSARTRYSP